MLIKLIVLLVLENNTLVLTKNANRKIQLSSASRLSAMEIRNISTSSNADKLNNKNQRLESIKPLHLN